MGVKRIEKKELIDIEPALSEDIAGAWLHEDNRHLRPGMLLTSWKEYLSKKGVSIEENCELIDFEIKENTVVGVNTGKGRFKADAFVLATGAWAPRTLQQLKPDLPVQPGKGYSITMERPGLCPSRPCSFYEKSVVVTPWKSGYRLGGTMEFSGYDDDLNPGRLARIISGAKEYLREPLGRPVIEQWAGFRPMTYDDLPIIDRAPSHENLIIATGHGMLGLTLSTGTGKLVRDMVYNKPTDIDITPFCINRFG